ncbi:hypothetical protein EHYA_02341 [Embleya hyalina]|uniref:Uncharacterized protein n=2 Tax=Embleya hyalina TaxID=516124 RepID=A0A401YJ75_9ACTN|nr:hypothetical protein EHYA_02341 [Embleya hyalina]
MALSIMPAVAFVPAATLRLLPAVLGRLGHEVNAAAPPWTRRNADRAGAS